MTVHLAVKMKMANGCPLKKETVLALSLNLSLCLLKLSRQYCKKTRSDCLNFSWILTLNPRPWGVGIAAVAAISRLHLWAVLNVLFSEASQLFLFPLCKVSLSYIASFRKYDVKCCFSAVLWEAGDGTRSTNQAFDLQGTHFVLQNCKAVRYSSINVDCQGAEKERPPLFSVMSLSNYVLFLVCLGSWNCLLL